MEINEQERGPKPVGSGPKPDVLGLRLRLDGTELYRRLVDRAKAVEASYTGSLVTLPDQDRREADVRRLRFLADHVALGAVYWLTEYELTELRLIP